MQIKDFSIIDALAPAEARWREAAIAFYRNWIKMIAETSIRTCAPLNAGTKFAVPATYRMTQGGQFPKAVGELTALYENDRV